MGRGSFSGFTYLRGKCNDAFWPDNQKCASPRTSAYVKKGFQFNTDTGCVTDFATKMNTFTTATTEQTALTSTQFIESTVTTNDRPPHTQDKIDKCNVQIKFEK